MIQAENVLDVSTKIKTDPELHAWVNGRGCRVDRINNQQHDVHKEDTMNGKTNRFRISVLENVIEGLRELLGDQHENNDPVLSEITKAESELYDRQCWASDAETKPQYYVAFTGHRPTKIGGYNDKAPQRVAVKAAIEGVLDRAIAKYGKTHQIVIITGGALGVDQDAARVAHKLGLPFIVAVPCQGQDSKWPAESKKRYAKMLDLAYDVVMVHDGPYNNTCLNDRNEWMVNHCDALVAVWDGSSGGTAHCVQYARKVGKPIVRINPTDLNKEVQ